MTENSICGGCTQCCKLLGIEELEKPALRWCQHCTIGKGCNVYEARPRSCRTYLCTYYQGAEQGTPWPPALRPDRCRVVIDYMPATEAHYVRVDPSRPDAWKKPLVQRVLQDIAGQGFKLFLVMGEKMVPLKLLGGA